MSLYEYLPAVPEKGYWKPGFGYRNETWEIPFSRRAHPPGKRLVAEASHHEMTIASAIRATCSKTGEYGTRFHSPNISVMSRRRVEASSSERASILDPRRVLPTARIWSTAISAGRPSHRTGSRQRQAG